MQIESKLPIADTDFYTSNLLVLKNLGRCSNLLSPLTSLSLNLLHV